MNGLVNYFLKMKNENGLSIKYFLKHESSFVNYFLKTKMKKQESKNKNEKQE